LTTGWQEVDASPRPRFAQDTMDKVLLLLSWFGLRLSRTNLPQLGIRGFLDEFVAGESIIVEMLRKIHKIHQG